MENLDQGLTTLTRRDPNPFVQLLHPLSQFDAPSGQSMPESNTDGNGHVPIDIPPALVDEPAEAAAAAAAAAEEEEEEEEEEDAPSTSIIIGLPTKFHHNKIIWKLLLSAALFAMYPSLAQVCQLKFTNKSPFETHAFFSNMGVVAYAIAIPAAVAFFAMASFLEGFANVYTSGIYCIYMILRCIFCFLVILAPLSLVLLLLIPTSNYYWIGYLIISLLVVFIITYNVTDYLKRGYKKNPSNLGSVQRDRRHHHIRD